MKKKKKTEQKPNRSSIKGYIIGILACIPFLLFGAALIGVSISEFSFTSPCTAETTGTVKDVSKEKEIKRDSRGRWHIQYTYTAHYTYEIDGETVDDTLVTSKRIKDGQTVRIRYVPDDPEHKYVKGYDDAGNLLPMVVGIVWDAFFLLIIYAIIVSLRHKLSEKNTDAH